MSNIIRNTPFRGEGAPVVDAFERADVAGERIETITAIGTLIYECQEFAFWPETQALLVEMLEQCRNHLEAAYADHETACEAYDREVAKSKSS